MVDFLEDSKEFLLICSGLDENTIFPKPKECRESELNVLQVFEIHRPNNMFHGMLPNMLPNMFPNMLGNMLCIMLHNRNS